MAQAIGSYYKITKVPIRLYWDSYRAAARDTTSSGYIQQTGSYKIINVAWTNAQGQYFSSEPSSGGIALYALNGLNANYGIGWVRDDDNAQRGTIQTTQSTISTEQATINFAIKKMKASTYKLQLKIGSTIIDTISGSDANESFTKSIELSEKYKEKIYSLMAKTTTMSGSVVLETFYNGVSLGIDSKSFTFQIPDSIKPSITIMPTYSFKNQVDGFNFANITTFTLTNTPKAIASRGATITQTRVNLGNGIQSINATNWKLISKGETYIEYIFTDSRGKTVSHKKIIDVIDAIPISISSIVATRNGNNGIKVDGRGSYVSTVEKRVTYSIYYKERNVETWSKLIDGYDFKTENNTFSFSYSNNSGFAADKSFDIRVEIIGYSSKAVGFSVIGTETVPLSLGKHGSGIGTLFDNSNIANLQVGSGGINSLGNITIQKNMVVFGVSEKELQGQTNLNSITETGIYYVGSSVSDLGILNTPTTERFKLDVVKVGTMIFQNVHDVANNLYVRTFGSEWSEWKEVGMM